MLVLVRRAKTLVLVQRASMLVLGCHRCANWHEAAEDVPDVAAPVAALT